MSNLDQIPENVADAFRALDERARRILVGSGEGSGQANDSEGKLRLLPSSVHQLARRVEASDEFIRLAIALFDLTSREMEPTKREEDRGMQVLRELLRRSGYYHGVAAGEASEPYWDRIAARVRDGDREVEDERFLVLGRVHFPRSSFEIDRWRVLQMSEIKKPLGPDRRACEDFYPQENLDDYDDRWVLAEPLPPPPRTEEEQQELEKCVAAIFEKFGIAEAGQSDASANGPTAEKKKSNIGEVDRADLNRSSATSRPCFTLMTPVEVATEKWLHFRSDAQLDRPQPLDCLEPLFLLSLYSDRFLPVTELLVCEPGWHIDRIATNPVENHYATDIYEIRDEEWERFEDFIQLCERARSQSREWRPMELAKRHYLTATFAPDDPFRVLRAQYYYDGPYPDLFNFSHSYDDDPIHMFETVLLHYIFAIEALLNNGSDSQVPSGDIANRARDLVGQSSSERPRIEKFVKKAYRLRNLLAHGKEIEPSDLAFDLRMLRRLCQRVICVALALLEGCPEKEVGQLLRCINTSRKAQSDAKAPRNRIYRLIQDDSPFPDEYDVKL